MNRNKFYFLNKFYYYSQFILNTIRRAVRSQEQQIPKRPEIDSLLFFWDNIQLAPWEIKKQPPTDLGDFGRGDITIPPYRNKAPGFEGDLGDTPITGASLGWCKGCNCTIDFLEYCISKIGSYISYFEVGKRFLHHQFETLKPSRGKSAKFSKVQYQTTRFF